MSGKMVAFFVPEAVFRVKMVFVLVLVELDYGLACPSLVQGREEGELLTLKVCVFLPRVRGHNRPGFEPSWPWALTLRDSHRKMTWQNRHNNLKMGRDTGRYEVMDLISSLSTPGRVETRRKNELAPA